jgi:RNA polymerase sigma-70 factor (ECF subfamily)
MTRPDDDLREALADDLVGQFTQLVERFQQRLFAFALRLTGSRQDAEDIVQEAFVGAYVSLENYPSSRIRALQLQAWLYKITLHTYLHHRRGASTHYASLTLTDDAAMREVADAPEEQPDLIFERGEQRTELLALLAQLPERYRIPITGYFLEFMTYQEIANLLDQPLGTVKSAIHRGLARLRAQLTERGKEGQPWNTTLLVP